MTWGAPGAPQAPGARRAPAQPWRSSIAREGRGLGAPHTMTAMSERWADAYRTFTWDASLQALGWSLDGDLNLGHTIVDRHRGSGRVALRWFGKDGRARDASFDQLAEATNRFANLLRALGVGKGDRVAGYLPRTPETLVIMLGTWKLGAVYVPIFTGFGPEAIAYRVAHSGAVVLCTQWEHRPRVPAPFADGAKVVTVGRRGSSTYQRVGAAGSVGVTASVDAAASADDIDFDDAMATQSDRFEPARCRRDNPAVLLYTSGSTGPPKGVKIATNFALAVHPYMRYAVDLRPDDVFWPTGDPGWGYGLVCYMTALALGVPVISLEAAPAPELCSRTPERPRGDEPGHDADRAPGDHGPRRRTSTPSPGPPPLRQ